LSFAAPATPAVGGPRGSLGFYFSIVIPIDKQCTCYCGIEFLIHTKNEKFGSYHPIFKIMTRTGSF
jgi:hypothetical protein